ncbi:hypothetical protein NPIL_551491 [Nephila pilipes]|uniref:Uncharacterized protein n=1 Tax=Nephila pilipes TaxID=299642 RepID=A0A8X6UKC8_NEPPI|nr:hypothetical protein NPIL_551491 [Nephila pilipes]
MVSVSFIVHFAQSKEGLLKALEHAWMVSILCVAKRFHESSGISFTNCFKSSQKSIGQRNVKIKSKSITNNPSLDWTNPFKKSVLNDNSERFIAVTIRHTICFIYPQKTIGQNGHLLFKKCFGREST